MTYAGLFGLMAAATLVAVLLLLAVGLVRLDGAEIGGTYVPAVHCQEDEAIFWVGVDELGCVHADEVSK